MLVDLEATDMNNNKQASFIILYCAFKNVLKRMLNQAIGPVLLCLSTVLHLTYIQQIN